MTANPLHFALRFVLALLSMGWFAGHSSAQRSGYELPPPEVVDIIDAAPEPSVSLSPNTEWMLLVDRDAMPSIADVSRRMLRLAGLRIDPAANGRFLTSFNSGISLRRRDQPAAEPVPIVKDAKISSVSWSHDSRSVAYVLVKDAGQELWVVDVDQPTQPRLLTDRLNTVMSGVTWMPDAKHILCHLVPEDRGQEPAQSSTPMGPSIEESLGQTSPTRTYQDLLSNPSDEALFEYYATTQLAIIGLDGQSLELGQPGLISDASPSPNGEFLLVKTIERPFSYVMTYRSFPETIQVWETASGTLQSTFAEIPMAENIPIEGVPTGPRNVGWHASRPARLVWVEALDGGDPNRDVDFRDRWMFSDAPFEQPGEEFLKLEHRASGIEYFDDEQILIASEYDRDRRWTRSTLHYQDGVTPPKTIEDRSIRDSYADPGNLMKVPNAAGRSVVRQDESWVYRSGSGASDDGDLPFVDRQDLRSLETERLWQCEVGTYERAVAMVSSSANMRPVIITLAETPTTPSNYFLRDLNDPDSAAIALTDFRDPTPQIRGITKQLVNYQRPDGVPLSATLYLPADYQPGTRLPLLVWAYPREFNDVKTAAQVSGSPSRFTRMSGITHLTLLTQGYAIMDAATMPVIGDPETMNDTFIEQIVAAAQAAIDKAVEMGVADRDRVAVGGHSYGAFMTANLLAHCRLFKAGVARSGAYNRTLTPFGFQSERRSFWDAKDVYYGISPFMFAHQIKDPLLLIHGEDDNNSGTFPTQSKRMYQAVMGNGGTVRLCMLPAESHGYRARESVLHTQAEMIAWLNKFVRDAEPAAQPNPAVEVGATTSE